MERLSVETGDIINLEVDAIVNAANEQLARGGGVCGAIFRAAGPRLNAACAALAPCPTGEACLTPGFDAKARWIVHAVGPVWGGGDRGEHLLLAAAYRNSLACARNVGAASIAFPGISTGIYGYPVEAAARVAVTAVREWCAAASDPQRIVFCCFSEKDAEIYRSALGA